MKNRIQDLNIDNLTVIVRSDLNVTIKDGVIVNDNKIVESLQTIQYLVKHNCKIIVMSHFGKVEKETDKKDNSIEIVAKRLSELLDKEIKFCPYTSGNELVKMVNELKEKDILLMENTRYEDVPNKLESNNDPQLAMFWAELGDVFINDAFASSHREHASVVGIPKYIPSALGFCIQKEIDYLYPLIHNPERPFTIIMGGAKIDDKLELIETLIKECDYLMLGGGIANTFLKALNLNVGFSLVNDNVIEKIKKIMIENKDKILLPLDVITTTEYDPSQVNYRLINQVADDEIIYDVGSRTIEKYKTIIDKSSTIFLNGTMGLYENKKFRNGTEELLNILSKSNAKVYVGGGDSVSSVTNLGFKDKLYYLSTGGGATLEYISKDTLPGIEAIGDVK